MKVSVLFEGKEVNVLKFKAAQQLIGMGLADVQSWYPLKIQLKHHLGPKDTGEGIMVNNARPSPSQNNATASVS